jgi:epoxyqueuosine reductase
MNESSLLSSTTSRRNFLRTALLTGSLFSIRLNPFAGIPGTKPGKDELPKFVYKYRTFSVRHLEELQEDIEKFKREGKISNNEIFRSYIDTKTYDLPENLANASSVIVMAVFTKLMFVNFHWNGKIHNIMIPPQYYDDGITLEQLRNTVQKDIIKKDGYRLEHAQKVLLKRMAVRSGLGTYGKNNICYVDGMGSYITLYAFFTDCPFEADHWGEVKMLDNCSHCRICLKQCPTRAITNRNFIIDAGRCITLYNERDGKFPNWIKWNAHNALMGCMKCQLHCPANHEVYKLAGRLDDVTEDETRKIIKGEPDDALIKSLTAKLKSYYPATSEKYFPIFTRNLKVLI